MIAAVGMSIAVAATLLLDGMGNWGLIFLGLGIGTAVLGVIASIRVQMTEMPQMVALYNGVGGGAVALIAWSEIRHGIPLGDDFQLDEPIPVLFSGGRRLGLLLGLEHRLRQAPGPVPTRPLAVPGQHIINALLLIGDPRRLRRPRDQPRRSPRRALFIALPDRRGDPRQPLRPADRRRRHAGGDLAAERVHRPLRRGRRLRARQRRPDRRRHPGRLLGNDPHARDGDGDEPLGRQPLFSGFGAVAAGGGGRRRGAPAASIGAQDAAIKLAYADSVVFVPGYGMAVAQAQHAVKELADELEKRGVTVSYAIHPVAGRMPGHMNVLLAEADVPYEQLKEMEEINPEMPRTDVAVVVGANDVTNPAAKDDPDRRSPACRSSRSTRPTR